MSDGEKNEHAKTGGLPQPTKEQLDQKRRDAGEHMSGNKEGDGFGGGAAIEGDPNGASPTSGEAPSTGE